MSTKEIEAQLRAKLLKDQEEEILGNKIHNAIREVLTAFVGKKLTKRFTDKVTAAVKSLFPEPDRVVCYYPDPGKLTLWVHGSIPYDKRWSFYIAGVPGYSHPEHSIAHPTLEGFEHEEQCHGTAALERIKERAFLIEDESPNNPLQQLVLAVHNLQAAKEQLQRIVEPYNLSIAYEAQRIAEGRSRA